MKYTLPAKSLLEIEMLSGGILITETRYPQESAEVFIDNDRIEELIEMFQKAIAYLKGDEA
jgi:hypothetical protein